MLYPIALVAFIVLWVLDRLLIAYYYQKPPTYSTESTQATLRIMWYMPIFSLLIAFWMLGNEQMFNN